MGESPCSQVVGPDLAHRRKRLEQEAATVLGAATVAVVALVRCGGEEALRQVAVREMQFQPFEADVSRPLRGIDEVLAHAVDVVERHGARLPLKSGTIGDR